MKENLQKLLDEGFRYVAEYSQNLVLYNLGHEFVIFHEEDDFESLRYDDRNKFKRL
jgi:hypothetical protein